MPTPTYSHDVCVCTAATRGEIENNQCNLRGWKITHKRIDTESVYQHFYSHDLRVYTATQSEIKNNLCNLRGWNITHKRIDTVTARQYF